MALLSSTAKVQGSSSPSGLLRSAATLAAQIQNYNDSIESFKYTNDHSDTSFQTYSDYLNGRISSLRSAGGITNAQKALSLTRELDTAGKANISWNIQNENLQVLSGNASNPDKYTNLTNLFTRAMANGDMNLAQTIETQAYSLSQTMQKDAADAAAAYETLAPVNAALQAAKDLGVQGAGPLPLPTSSSSGGISPGRSDWVQMILNTAPKYGVDPQAALAVASAEGLGGGVGDSGTSFGPFQLHQGGALPAGKDRAWAESQAGIDYALQRIGQVAGGLTGAPAVAAIVTNFERPANPGDEISRATAAYGNVGASSAATANLPANATPAEVIAAETKYGKQQVQAISKSLLDTGAQLIDSLKQLTTDVQNPTTGSSPEKALKNWVTTNRDAILKLNPEAAAQLDSAIKSGAQPNYFNIVAGVIPAAANAYLNAAKIVGPLDPTSSTAQTYIDKAKSLLNDPVGGLLTNKDLTYSQILQAANTPGEFSYNQSTGKYEQNAQTGLSYQPIQYDAKGNVTGGGVLPTYQNNAPKLTTDQVNQINKLKLQPITNTTSKNPNQGTVYQITPDSPDWLKSIAKQGSQITVYGSPQGLQFTADSASASGKAIYTVVKDSRGLMAPFESSAQGDKLLGGDYGFTLDNPSNSKGFFSRIGQSLLSGINGSANSLFGLFSGHASAQTLVNSSQIAAATALRLAPPPPAPTLNLAPPMTQPTLSLAPPSFQSPTPVQTPTFNPQPAAPLPGPAPTNPQPTINPQPAAGGNVLTGGGSLHL